MDHNIIIHIHEIKAAVSFLRTLTESKIEIIVHKIFRELFALSFPVSAAAATNKTFELERFGLETATTKKKDRASSFYFVIF